MVEPSRGTFEYLNRRSCLLLVELGLAALSPDLLQVLSDPAPPANGNAGRDLAAEIGATAIKRQMG